jgi:hypothetical protein
MTLAKVCPCKCQQIVLFDSHFQHLQGIRVGVKIGQVVFRGIAGGQFLIARRQTDEAGDEICQDYWYCHDLPIFLNVSSALSCGKPNLIKAPAHFC